MVFSSQMGRIQYIGNPGTSAFRSCKEAKRQTTTFLRRIYTDESTAKTNSATEITEKAREKNSKNSVVSVAEKWIARFVFH
jgi:hypothetical protein